MIQLSSEPQVQGALTKATAFIAMVVTVGLFVTTSAFAAVGFYAPRGLNKQVIQHTQIGAFLAVTPQQLRQNLQRMQGTSFKAYVAFGHVTTEPTDPSTLTLHYAGANGVRRVKAFKPVPGQVMLRRFLPDATLKAALEPFLPVLAEYRANVAGVFIADEPYSHGITKAAMEHAGSTVRVMLDAHGLQKVKLGVVFAAGMFNAPYAEAMERNAAKYTAAIDDRFDRGDASNPIAFATWVNSTAHARLSTYDATGNTYIGGGPPNGFQVFGFDFYLSTLLFDGQYEDVLSWFAAHHLSAPCRQFANVSVSDLRQRLSFSTFEISGRNARREARDGKILNAVYDCRMGAVTAMLERAAAGHHAELLLVSGSSANFDPKEAGKPGDNELVATRVLREVRRAEVFYTRHRAAYSAGLLFFPYKTIHDHRTHQTLNGVAGMPKVMASIYSFAGAEALKGATTKDVRKARADNKHP